MSEAIFSMVIALDLCSEARKDGIVSNCHDSEIVRSLIELTDSHTGEVVSAKLFTSLRFDCDYVLWVTARNVNIIPAIRSALEASGYLRSFPYYFLSLYEDSPYTKEGITLEDTLRKGSLNYLVAYPMSKSNDWYLLPFDERKRIMAQHIGMAVSHRENRNIRSYTTYSFGISDQEFVVIYEVDSLVAWSHVTSKLREAEARKWITKETPILVGSRCWEFISEV
ncbi:MAG: chlorite dismutase family protein [Candidatus Thermoplasmatota archaeon]|nr:chlorite dismutase family protein [Candidatus Thermoplasmatota archaeon]MCL5730856.1 chlorite dismutase family protein [Candidatus Thermoplasmatota archaeon]